MNLSSNFPHALHLIVAVEQLLTSQFTRLTLEDGSFADMSPPWVAEHQPAVGGYLVDQGDDVPHGYAKPLEAIEAAPVASARRECRPLDELEAAPAPEPNGILVESIARLSLTPGDILVLTLPLRDLDRATADAIYQELAPKLPPGVELMIKPKDVHLSIVAPAGVPA